MHARTGKVRPQIGFHGPIAMQSIRRRARWSTQMRREQVAQMREMIAAQHHMRAVFSQAREEVGIEDPRIKPPRMH